MHTVDESPPSEVEQSELPVKHLYSVHAKEDWYSNWLLQESHSPLVKLW